MRRCLASAVFGLAVLGRAIGPAAASEVTPARTLAPACQAFMTGVLAREDPGSLPVQVLWDPAPKVGRYVVTVGDSKIGDVRVDTVLTGWMEYQAGEARARTPFFCLGRGRKVGYYYACQHSPQAPDRIVLPVRECHERSPGDAAAATGCLRGMLAASESALAAAGDAARERATRAGQDAASTYHASEREFATYRTRSCEVFRAPDASTDAPDFLYGCLVRLNAARTRLLGAAPAR